MITISVGDCGDRGTGSLAEVCVVPSRADDPVIPAKLLEAHIQRLPAALAGGSPAL